MVQRPESKDMATRVAEGFAQRLSNITDSIKESNPVGFGQEELTAEQYRKRILAMSREERLAEIESKGIDVVTNAMRTE